LLPRGQRPPRKSPFCCVRSCWHSFVRSIKKDCCGQNCANCAIGPIFPMFSVPGAPAHPHGFPWLGCR
jgi:hypothetical protein